MKRINLTINVSDNKFDQLVEFLSTHFGAEITETTSETEVPYWHQEIILNRLEETRPDDYFPFEDLDEKIKL